VAPHDTLLLTLRSEATFILNIKSRNIMTDTIKKNIINTVVQAIVTILTILGVTGCIAK
jgi:hypothetical protein